MIAQTSTLRHGLIALAALVGTTIGFSATTAPARAQTPAYSAQLAAPLAAPVRVVLGDAAWSCEGAACRAANDTSRPLVTCQRLAGKFGELAGFTSPKGALAAEDLSKCNAKANGKVARAAGAITTASAN